VSCPFSDGANTEDCFPDSFCFSFFDFAPRFRVPRSILMIAETNRIFHQFSFAVSSRGATGGCREDSLTPLAPLSHGKVLPDDNAGAVVFMRILFVLIYRQIIQ
jgi:hypothetical protein